MQFCIAESSNAITNADSKQLLWQQEKWHIQCFGVVNACENEMIETLCGNFRQSQVCR